MKGDSSPFHYQSYGSKSDSPVLFLHGFMGDHRDWEHVVGALSQEFHCIAVDLPGHGNTPLAHGRLPGAFDLVVDSLNEFLNDLAVESVSLVGYSMGGRIALAFAAAEPGRVRRLVLESASPGLKTDEERRERLISDGAVADELAGLEKTGFARFLEEWYDQPLFLSLKQRPEVRQAIVERRLQNDPRQLAGALRAFGTGVQESLWQTMERLDVPALLIAGEEDSKYVALANEMARHLKSARVFIAPEVGHIVHAESPTLFIEELRRFLR